MNELDIARGGSMVATIEQLQAADAGLTRSFIACVTTVLIALGWALFVGPPPPGQIVLFPLLAGLCQLAAYVWYAVSAGAAAKAVGAVGWHYVVWILAAPVLGLIPIPIVSTIIGVSPLSIKFLLGGQLQTAIREQTFAQLHEPS
jgi:hypothetical protein